LAGIEQEHRQTATPLDSGADGLGTTGAGDGFVVLGMDGVPIGQTIQMDGIGGIGGEGGAQ